MALRTVMLAWRASLNLAFQHPSSSGPDLANNMVVGGSTFGVLQLRGGFALARLKLLMLEVDVASG